MAANHRGISIDRRREGTTIRSVRSSLLIYKEIKRAVLFFHSPLPVAFVVPFISRGRRAASSPASKLHALKKEAPALVRLTLLPLLLSLDRRRKSAPDAGLIGKVGS
ncbi:hypothetical protein MUK42_11059 [Musa troglodytarum]|uniref:Uncharacterized protein n=1 Tax=Musa troglodytarum TaxID=320322 RepID=A0A9E7KEK0_9LILI|nr:hypothetical protein MUK42_11059 [Musa troglodytarum]